MDIFSFLEANKFFIYIILSFWVIFSSIFPLNLFIFSEIFILSWSIFAGLEITDFFTTFFLLIISWFIWDSISFFIWLIYRDRLFDSIFSYEFIKKKINLYKYDKIYKSFELRPFFSVFAWKFWYFSHYFTPFIAWSLKIKYIDFLKYSSFWIVLSVWFLSFIWFFVWENLINFFIFIKTYVFLLLFLFLIFCSLYFYFKKYIVKSLSKYWKDFEIKKIFLLKLFFKHFFWVSLIIFIFYCITLYLIFFSFWIQSKTEKLNFDYKLNSINEITNYSSLYTYYFWKRNEIIQPINIILITNSDIKQTLSNLWWIENKTFIWKNINVKEFYSLYKSKELPVSNLYLDWKVQNMAFQMKSNSNFKRVHLRVWNFWIINNKKIYFISISKDTKIDIEMYNNFFTPIHDIDYDIDKQRDFFFDQIKLQYSNLEYKKEKISEINSNLYKYNYYSDWFFYIINI